MKRVTVTIAWAAVAGLLLTATYAAAQANGASPQAQQLTILSFSGPVRVPGAILSAGEYIVRLANPDTDGQTVEILTKSGKPVVRLVTASIARPENNTSEVLMLDEGTGQIPALRAWFYPGLKVGHEFLFSREEARDLSHKASVDAFAAHLPNAQGDVITIVRMTASGEEQVSTEKAGENTTTQGAASAQQ